MNNYEKIENIMNENNGILYVKDLEKYNTSIILMTDGIGNVGNYNSFIKNANCYEQLAFLLLFFLFFLR